MRKPRRGVPYPPTPSPAHGGGGADKRRNLLWVSEPHDDDVLDRVNSGADERRASPRVSEADPEHTVARRIRTRIAARELRGRRTDTEKRLWAELRLYKIDGLQFRQQHPIGPYIVDFCCYRVRLIVEIDGELHETQREYDAERDDYLRNLGYTVLRIPVARILHDLDAVLTEIRAACSPSPAHGGGGWGVGADSGATHRGIGAGTEPGAALKKIANGRSTN